MSLNVGEFLVNQAKCLLQTGRGNIIWADAEEELVNLTLKCSYSPFNNWVHSTMYKGNCRALWNQLREKVSANQ